MAILKIFTRVDLLEYREQVRLDGVLFTLLFKFNGREGSWYVDVLDSTEAPIRLGVKLVTGIPLLRLVATEGRPAGDLFAVDPTGADQEPTLETLGTTVPLLYAEAADLP